MRSATPSRAELLALLRRHRHAVQASVSPAGFPQAAVVGVAVSDSFELVFDTLADTRKARNLAEHHRIAVVFGGLEDGEAETVQYEGIVDRPGGSDLDAVRELYFHSFPDGRARLAWPGLIHLRARPTWLRYSDYRGESPVIIELNGADLALLR